MCVYFIKNPNTGLIKIGKAKNVFERIHALMVEHKTDLRILGTIEGYQQKENELHEKFAVYNNHLEWFNPAEEIIEYIAIHCCNGSLNVAQEKRLTVLPIATTSKVSELATEIGLDTPWKLAWACRISKSASDNVWRGDLGGARLSTLIKVAMILGCKLDDLYSVS